MSSHSGTIGRKRGGSGSGSEYYFTGGEHNIRRQRSAEWHSRHAYNSSSEDEYQNTGQASAFDTQLLAQLLLQSQQLANMDRYNSDFENEEHLSSRLNEYPSSVNRDLSNMTANSQQSYFQQLQMEHQHQSTELCSPLKQSQTANIQTPTTSSSMNTANNKFLNNANLGFLPTSTRSTNPFLNAKYDSQSNSDSISDRISFSGSSAVLDRLQNAPEYATINNASTVLNTSYLLPDSSSTANTLSPNVREAASTRSQRAKTGRNVNRASGMTSSSSATSSNSNATLNNPNNRNEKLKLQQQLQMELREFSESQAESLNASVANGLDIGDDICGAVGGAVGIDAGSGDMSELHILCGDDTDPPPEPAPPEIPPRTQSLLMSLRKHSEYKLKYEEKGDQKHEEFIPTSQLQHQQKDYLIADTVRCSESQSKSIASSDTQSQQG